MIRSRVRLKAFGLSALVLAFGLTAAWAYVAQAEETGGKWTYINPTTGELKAFEGALAEPSFNGVVEAGTTISLSTKVLGGTSLKYECKSLTFNEGKLKGPEGGGSAALELKECEAFFNGALSKNCAPSGGIIKTNKIKAAMLLHKLAGGTVDKVLIDTPAEGSGFAFINSTEACNVGEKVLIGGKVAFQDAAPTTHSVNHLIKEFSPLTHLWIISDTAEHAATLTGSIELFLTGEHVNYKWAGLWN